MKAATGESRTRLKKAVCYLSIAVFLLVCSAFCLSRAVDRGISHDEHQFVAPAILWARYGLLPYRDVALFHQPYLIAFYAAVGGWTEQPFLLMRLVSACASTATAALLFWVGWKNLAGERDWKRVCLPAAVIILWLTGSLFIGTSGLTWNHDLPAFLVILATVLVLQKTDWRKWLLAGLLAGMAVGCRLTFAPFALALGLLPLIWPQWTWRERLKRSAACSLGVFFALLPSLWLCSLDPEAYYFGNFFFPRLPLLDADNARILKTITPLRKLRFFFKEILLANWPLFLSVAGALPVLWLHWKKRQDFRGLALLGLTIALAAGCFAPSRYETQHFYVLAPFAAVLLMNGLPLLRGKGVTAVVCLLASVSVIQNWSRCETMGDVLEPKEWMIATIHRQALLLKREVGDGRVLTLAPILPLEAGLDIYPELATGPFGFRFAHLLEQKRRARVNLFAPDELAGRMANDPPAAILSGMESRKAEQEILRYARARGWQSRDFWNHAKLWRAAH